uniref:Knottin scorpion toxin-like domain-containing protein n=1 Tax=Aegilops tauschii subsp. strangulata TaxID=200361 RepID=A0A453QF57_AEGTS
MAILKRNTRVVCLAVLVVMATTLLPFSTTQGACLVAPECSGPYPNVICGELCACYGYSKNGYCKDSRNCCCSGKNLKESVQVDPTANP